MIAESGAPLVGAAPLRVPLRRRVYGFGSVFGKTLRDSRTGALVMATLLGGLVLAGGAAMASAYGTPETRRELAIMSSSLPPIMTGLYGNPVNVDTLGGFVTWHYGAYLALLAGLWSILALSGTLAGEARRGSLELAVAAPISRIRIAIEKIAGHVTALVGAAAIVGLAAWLTSAVFAQLPQDTVTPEAAIAFAAGIAARALIAGSLAFALAPFVGRGAAAGLAGAVMLGGYVVNSYRSVVPELDAIAGVSWFAWMAGHLPLAGRWDWGAVAAVVAASLVLLAVGTIAFARRDIGVTGTSRMPVTPGALLGVRGPLRRSVGELLPAAFWWGIGLGLYALVMAASTRAFVAEMVKIPSLTAAIATFLPGVDMTTPAGFFELLFVDFGLVIIGLAAASLVAQRWSDETAGRLEVQLATPLTRARWAISSGIAVWFGIAVITGLVMAAVAVGIASSGGEVTGPMTGMLVLALYGAAMAGIGFAVGGLVRASLAGTAVAVLAVATFLVDILGPALDLPDWVHELALSAHMGQPMVGVWDAAGMGVALVLAVGGVLLGAWGMRRRDVLG